MTRAKLIFTDYFHYIVVALSILLTFFAWYFSNQQIEQKIQNRFNDESDKVISQIIERMVHYEDALWAGVSLIKTNDYNVSFLYWKKYVSELNLIKKYPGINGLGIIYKVDPKDKDAFLKKVRKDNQPNFKIHPVHHREILYPITFIIPIKGNEKAVGLDMAHEDNRFNALMAAAKSGGARITGPIVLVQDAKKTPGFLFYAPFYSKNQFIGVVYAPFIVKKLLDGTLSKENRHISVNIADNTEEIYSEYSDSTINKLSFRKEIELYGRTWKFNTIPKKSFMDLYNNNQSYIILIGGIIIDFLIIILFVVIKRNEGKAKKYAKNLNKELSDSKDELETILNNTYNTSIIQTDLCGRITYLNKGTYFVTQNKKTISIGENFLDVINIQSKDGVVKDFDSFVQGSKEDANKYFIQNLHEPIYLSVYVKKKNDRYLFILIDISKETIAQTLKDEFISTINHEIRTPLTAIKAGLFTMDKYIDNDIKKTKGILQVANENCERMMTLVNDLLDLSKIEQNGLEIVKEKFDLDELLQSTIGQMNYYMKYKAINFIYDSHSMLVFSDKNKLAQVLNNILSNAIKVSPNNSDVIIKINDATPGIYNVSITDKGEGIPDHLKDKLFNKFSQLDGKINRKIQGSGLGLYISKKIMDALEGDITFESQENVGTTFHIWIKK